jgi:hypothetical protein
MSGAWLMSRKFVAKIKKFTNPAKPFPTNCVSHLHLIPLFPYMLIPIKYLKRVVFRIYLLDDIFDNSFFVDDESNP